MDLTICVGTFGDSEWYAKAHEVALPSARKFERPVVHVHTANLCDARNEALAEVETEWVAFLDADDELEHGYFEHMERATGDVRVPSVRYVRNGFDQGVRMPRITGHDHECSPDCLAFGNYIVIGAVVRTELLRKVGGFRDFPWSEDWDLWVRCWQAGATIESVPRAVYCAHVRKDSRNRDISAIDRVKAHNLIAEANGLPLVPA